MPVFGSSMLYLEVGEVFLTPAISHLLPVAEALKLSAGRLIVLKSNFYFSLRYLRLMFWKASV
jgi:hypothetical protein